MNDVPGGQTVAASDFGLACGATAELATLRQEFWAGGTMNGTIDAASAEQRLVGSVYDGIDD